MNLNIKPQIWEIIKENPYGFSKKSNCGDYGGISSAKIKRANFSLSKRGEKQKVFPYFYYKVCNVFDFKDFWGQIGDYHEECLSTVKYCRSKKEDGKQIVNITNAIDYGRLYCIDGIMFYNPQDTHKLYVCVNKDDKIIGFEEESL